MPAHQQALIRCVQVKDTKNIDKTNSMKCLTTILCSLLLTSCFRFNGRISIQNDSNSYLRIATVPIIASGSGGWENGIHYYNRDSIIWTYNLANNIKARILEPNIWKRRDSTFAQNEPNGHHYGDYGLFRNDTTVRGVYLMYPNSSFTIGEFNSHKKLTPIKDKIDGRFYIDKVVVYRDNDTLVGNNDREIWNLLLLLDENKDNFDKGQNRKRIRHWTAFIKP